MHCVLCCKVSLDVDVCTMTLVLHARLELIGLELCVEREDQCCYTVKEAKLDEDGNNITTVMDYRAIKALIAYQYSVLRSYENIYSIGYGTVTGDYVGLFRPMADATATLDDILHHHGLWVEMAIHVDESYGGTGQKMVHFDFPEELEILLSPFTSRTVSPSMAPSTFSPDPSLTPGPEPSPSPSPSVGSESEFECPYPSMTPTPSPSPATSWSICAPLTTALDKHHYDKHAKRNVSSWNLFEPKYRSWYADCVETFRIQKQRAANPLYKSHKDGYLLPRLLFDYFSGGLPVINYCLNKMEKEEVAQKFPRGVQTSGVWSERVGNVTRQAMVRDGQQIGNGYIVDRTGTLVILLAAAVDADSKHCMRRWGLLSANPSQRLRLIAPTMSFSLWFQLSR